MLLDPQIEIWVLIPIMIVMVLVGMLRHYGSLLLQSQPLVDYHQLRESNGLLKCRMLRSTKILPAAKYLQRKQEIIKRIELKDYLQVKQPPEQQQMQPQQMEQAMEMMKKNLFMFVPQTIIMSWVSFFFSGFVLTRLPFPLTLRFKEMVQRGIDTSDMDVRWVSSLSWYFLNLFGLTSVYTLLGIGSSNSNQHMNMVQINPMQQPSETFKLFENERELLDLNVYEFALEGVQDRVLEKYNKL